MRENPDRKSTIGKSKFLTVTFSATKINPQALQSKTLVGRLMTEIDLQLGLLEMRESIQNEIYEFDKLEYLLFWEEVNFQIGLYVEFPASVNQICYVLVVLKPTGTQIIGTRIFCDVSVSLKMHGIQLKANVSSTDG